MRWSDLMLMHPAWLALLPLALLPWLHAPGVRVATASLVAVPQDRASRVLDLSWRALASLAIALTVLALAQPMRREQMVERSGTGAQILLLLDRSRSMDQPFAASRPKGGEPKGTGPEALDYYMRKRGTERRSKGEVARELLARFAAGRPDDHFGMFVFSTVPIPVLPFTSRPDLVQAAISAGNIGRGLSETDIGRALLAGLHSFDGLPYTGSRLVLLVSDGGDLIAPDAREQIAALARRNRVGITWLYIRSSLSPGLLAQADAPPEHADAVPEYFLDRFFRTLGVPYHAYEAENPDDLQRAIDDVGRLQNLPMTWTETLARVDLTRWPTGLALLIVAALALAAGATRMPARGGVADARARPASARDEARAIRPARHAASEEAR